MKKLCPDCKSEIKLGKEKCSVCQYKEAYDKTVSVSIRLFDYQVISEALEIASKIKFGDGEKTKEFKEAIKNWSNLSKDFEIKVY